VDDDAPPSRAVVKESLFGNPSAPQIGGGMVIQPQFEGFGEAPFLPAQQRDFSGFEKPQMKP